MGYEIGSKRGVANHYGVRGTDNQYGGQDNSVGKIKEASWTFDWDKLPAYSASNLEMLIPANATIISCNLRTLTAGAAGSSTAMTVGLVNASTVVTIDADALLAAAQGTNTIVTTKGARAVGAGALLGLAQTVATEIVVAMSVALTAGRFELIVTYEYN